MGLATLAMAFPVLLVAANDKPVTIDSVPPGAQVEMSGRVTCTTPCSINLPGYYFGKKHNAYSAHATEPLHVKLTKQGYAAKEADLTAGPYQFISLYANLSYAYYLASSDHFTFQLDALPPVPVAPPVGGPVAPAQPKASPPATAILVASPSGVSPNQTVQIEGSSLVVRGVAMDSTGILMVTVNGAPASMRPQTSQATEFWSDPLPIAPGNTPIEIIASNPAHTETKLVFTVHYAPKAAPAGAQVLSKGQIIALLQGHVTNKRVAALVKERGIQFAPTEDDLNDIRHAGGDEELIQAIRRAAASN